MGRGNVPFLTFNRGRISRLALARTDLERTRVSAETQYNWMTRTLGSMMVRPGMQYLGEIKDNAKPVFIPFVFDFNDKALLELTTTSLRVWESDAVVQRSGVSSTVVNGDFSSSDLTGWTDSDDSGSTSYWITGNYLGFAGTRFSFAKRRANLGVVSSDVGTEVGIRTVVDRGFVYLRIGSSAGGDDYVNEALLLPGTFSFGVTSTSTAIHIQLASNSEYVSRVESVTVESSGDLVLPTPWSSTDLELIRDSASGDVTFTACRNIQPRRIERRNARNWGIRVYDPEDGPFRVINTGVSRLEPSGLTGNITLAAEPGIFRSGHVGSIFQITSIGQNVKATITDENQFTDAIRVSGVEDTRKFQYVVSQLGSTVGTVKIQRSDGEEGNWIDVSGLSFTSTIDSTHDDGFDNNITFYRIGVGSGAFTGDTSSDTVAVELNYASGGLIGVARIDSVISATESSASVLLRMGSTVATETWREGDWSSFRGYPTAVTLHENRTFWAGKAKIWASVSDSYESHDPEIEGDAGPINKSFGSGPVDSIPWLLPLGRLIIGAESRVEQAKTNSLDEPLTPTNYAIRPVNVPSGATAIQAIPIGTRGFYVQTGGERIFEISPPGVTQTLGADVYDYAAADRTVLVPELGEAGFTRLAVQHQPDTRLHGVLGDGSVAVLVSDPAENVSCWLNVGTTGANGQVEEVVTLPGSQESDVYYVVKREINGSTVRYLEKWATEYHARGGSSQRMADSFGLFHSSLGSSTITGATHLIGESVVLWGSAQAPGATTTGVDLGTATVSTSGTIDITSTIAVDSTTVCYGLDYDAWWKSVKLAYAAQAGTALTQAKKIDHLGLIMADVHARGLQFGRSTESTAVLDSLPVIVRGQKVSTDAVRADYDAAAAPFPGSWDTDSRVVLKGGANRSATILGMTMSISEVDKI